MPVFELGLEIPLDKALRSLDVVERRLEDIEDRMSGGMTLEVGLQPRAIAQAEKGLDRVEKKYRSLTQLVATSPLVIKVDDRQIDRAVTKVESLGKSASSLQVNAQVATRGIEQAMQANAKALAGLSGGGSIGGAAREVSDILKGLADTASDTQGSLQGLSKRANRTNVGRGRGGGGGSLTGALLAPLTLPLRTLTKSFNDVSQGISIAIGEQLTDIFGGGFFQGLQRSFAGRNRAQQQAGETFGRRSDLLVNAILKDFQSISRSADLGTAVQKFLDVNQRFDNILAEFRRNIIELEILPEFEKQRQRSRIDPGSASEAVLVAGGTVGGGRADRRTLETIRQFLGPDTFSRAVSQPELGQLGPRFLRDIIPQEFFSGLNLVRSQFQGVSGDAVKLAAQLAALSDRLGQQNVRAIGFSGGSANVTQALEVLQAAGLTDIRGQAIGLGAQVGSTDPQALQRLVSRGDPTARVFAQPSLMAESQLEGMRNSQNAIVRGIGDLAAMLSRTADIFSRPLGTDIQFPQSHDLDAYVESLRQISDFARGLGATLQTSVTGNIGATSLDADIAEFNNRIQQIFTGAGANPSQALAQLDRLGEFLPQIVEQQLVPALQEAQARIAETFGEGAARSLSELVDRIQSTATRVAGPEPGRALADITARVEAFGEGLSRVTVEQADRLLAGLTAEIERGGTSQANRALSSLQTSIAATIVKSQDRIAAAVRSDDFTAIASLTSEYADNLEAFFNSLDLVERAIRSANLPESQIQRLTGRTAQLRGTLGQGAGRLSGLLADGDIPSALGGGGGRAIDPAALSQAFDFSQAQAAVRQFSGEVGQALGEIRAAIGETIGVDASQFQQSARNIEDAYDRTVAAVRKGFSTLAMDAAEKGYDIQRGISEGSPGPSAETRSNWKKTVDFVRGLFGDLANSARGAGDRVSKELGGGLGRLRGILGDVAFSLAAVFGAVTVGDALVEFGRRSLDVARDLEIVRIRLDLLGESYENLVDRSNELGQSSRTVANAYRGFVQALQGTPLASQGDALFESFQTALAGAAGSRQQLENAFLAITQIAAKGRVSLEEINRQLAEALPGATAIAARALGVTQQEFIALVESGNLLAQDLLPRLAAQLETELGGSAERIAGTFTAEVNRLQNNLELLGETYGQTIISVLQPLTQLTNAIAGPLAGNLDTIGPVLQAVSVAVGANLLRTVTELALKLPFVNTLVSQVTANFANWTSATKAFNAVASGLGSTLSFLSTRILPIAGAYLAATFAVRQFTGSNEELRTVLEDIRDLTDDLQGNNLDIGGQVAQGGESFLQENLRRFREGFTGSVRDNLRQIELFQRTTELPLLFSGGFEQSGPRVRLERALQALERERGALQIEIEIATDRGDADAVAELTEDLLEIDQRRNQAIELAFPNINQLRSAVSGLEGIRDNIDDPAAQEAFSLAISRLNDNLEIADRTIQSASDSLGILRRSLQRANIAAAGITGTTEQLSRAFDISTSQAVIEGILDPRQLNIARTQFERGVIAAELREFEQVRDSLLDQLNVNVQDDAAQLVAFFSSRLGREFASVEDVLTLPLSQIEAVLETLEDAGLGSANTLLEIARLTQEIDTRQVESARLQADAQAEALELAERRRDVEESIASQRDALLDRALDIENQIFDLRQSQALRETERDIASAFTGLEGSLANITRDFLNERARAQSELESAERAAAQDIERIQLDVEQFKLDTAERVAEINRDSAQEVVRILQPLLDNAAELRSSLATIPSLASSAPSVRDLLGNTNLSGAPLNAIVNQAAVRGASPQFIQALVGTAIAESGLNPLARNNTAIEDSVGLFQANRQGGLGTGFTVGQLQNPELNTAIILDAVEQIVPQIIRSGNLEDIVRQLTTQVIRPANAAQRAEERIGISRQVDLGELGIPAQAAADYRELDNAIATVQDRQEELLSLQADDIPQAAELYRDLLADITTEGDRQAQQRERNIQLLQIESRLLQEGFRPEAVERLLAVEELRLDQSQRLIELERSIAAARSQGVDFSIEQEQALTAAIEEQTRENVERLQLEQQQTQIRDRLAEATARLVDIEQDFSDRLASVNSELAALQAGLTAGTATYDLFRESFEAGIAFDSAELASARATASLIDQRQAVLDLRQSYIELGDDIGRSIGSAVDGVFSDLIEGTKSTGDILLDFVENILNNIANSFANFISSGISDFLGGAFSGLFGSGGTGGGLAGLSGILGGNVTGIGFADFALPIFHDGGIVGGSGDRAVIAQGGEGIFTPRQMENAGRLIEAMAENSGKQELVVRFVDDEGNEIESQQNADGSQDIDINQLLATEAAKSNRPFARQLARMGLTPRRIRR